MEPRSNKISILFNFVLLCRFSTDANPENNKKNEILELRQLITDVQSRQRFYDNELAEQKQIIIAQAKEIVKLQTLLDTGERNRKVYSNSPGETSDKRQLQGGISFSVYLDHDVDLGAPEVLKYNQIITNDGSGYDATTGAFTCPETGVYMLTFYIGERGSYTPQGAYIYLKVNNVNIIDAVVDAPHNTQDLQGGNTVVIRLKAGDVVVTIHEDSGGHVEGATGLRLTSFSGFMLYS